jgi:hypothetical protein
MSAKRILIAGVAYGVIGIATAFLAGDAGSAAGVKGWRWAAWVLSAIVVALHIAQVFLRLRTPLLRGAIEVGLGAAVGGLLLAIAGPVRSHWGAPDFVRSALLSIPLWPLLLGLPTFGVALVSGYVLARSRPSI